MIGFEIMAGNVNFKSSDLSVAEKNEADAGLKMPALHKQNLPDTVTVVREEGLASEDKVLSIGNMPGTIRYVAGQADDEQFLMSMA